MLSEMMQGNSNLRCAFAMAMSAALSLLSSMACAQGAAPPASQPALSAGLKFFEMSGEELFANVCQACHMSDAKGDTLLFRAPLGLGVRRLWNSRT